MTIETTLRNGTIQDLVSMLKGQKDRMCDFIVPAQAITSFIRSACQSGGPGWRRTGPGATGRWRARPARRGWAAGRTGAHTPGLRAEPGRGAR